MPSRSTARPFHQEENPVLDARSLIEAPFGSPRPDYPLYGRPDALDLWLNHRLEPAYASVFFDSLKLRTRDYGLLRTTRLHFALGILDDGTKDIIGVWEEHCDTLWPIALSQLRTRGVAKIGLAVAEEDAAVRALHAEFPTAQITHSVRHLVEASVDFLPLAARRPAVTTTLRRIIDAQLALSPAQLASVIAPGETSLVDFWRENWERLYPTLNLPADVRELVCTTTAVESIVEKLRRRGLSKRTNYATTKAAIRELAFALRDASSSWKVAPRKWAIVRQHLRT
jgi:transposase-like protein